MSGIIGASNNMVLRARVYDDKSSNAYGYNNGHLVNGLSFSERNPLNQIARDASEDDSGDDSTSFDGLINGNLDNPTFTCADGNKRTITCLQRLVDNLNGLHRILLNVAHDVVPAGQSTILSASEVGTTLSTPFGSLNFADATIQGSNCPHSSWDNFNNKCSRFIWLLSGQSDSNDPLNTPADIYQQNDLTQAESPFADMRAFDNLIQVTIT